jgi:hypothetical protein
MRVKGHAIGFADTFDVAIRDELDEHEVTTAVVRRGIADNECLDVRKLHDDRFLKPGGK